MDEFLDEADPFRIKTTPETTEVKTLGRGKEQIQTPVAVIFDKPVEVTVKTRVPGAKMRYTTDGTEPTKDSPEYTEPIQLTKTTRLMVKAYKLGIGFSPTYTTTYVIQK